MSNPRKACPVVARSTNGCLEVLAFRHPIAGYQLVKGTIERDETVQRAAERELLEESGIAVTAGDVLGAVQMQEPAQEWHFMLCRPGRSKARGHTGQLTAVVWISSSFGILWLMIRTRIGIRYSSELSLSLASKQRSWWDRRAPARIGRPACGPTRTVPVGARNVRF